MRPPGRWDVSKVNVWFVLVLLAVLMLCAYVPAVPMFWCITFMDSPV